MFVFGFTVMELPVAPVDQVTVPLQPEAVRVDCPPTQKAAGEAVSEGAEGIGFTVIAIEPAGDTQPFRLQVAV